MTRALSVILAAILYLRPTMPEPEARKLAAKVQMVSAAVAIDPLLTVTIFWRESRLYPNAVGGLNGQCIGLGQICLHTFSACKSFSSPACQAIKTRLLDPVENVAEFGRFVEINRNLCAQKAKGSGTPGWLASYQGYNLPAKGVWCRPGRVTWQVLRKQGELMAKFGP